MPFTKETAREFGIKGGQATKERMLAKDPYYFEKIGLMGGLKTYEKFGSKHYQKIQRIGHELKLRDQQSSQPERRAGQ